MLRAQVAIITALLLLANAGVAHAAPEVPGIDLGAWAEQIAKAVTDQMGASVNHFIEYNLVALIWRFFLSVLGIVGTMLWGIIGALFGPSNFITQLPEQWTVGLDPVQRFIGRFTGIALTATAAMAVWTTIRLVIALGSFQPYGRWLRYYPRQMFAGVVILFAGQIITYALRFSNALSASMTDPTGGIAGVGPPSFDGFTAAGAMFIVFAFMALRFAVRRAKVLVITGLLIALTPLAIALWCMPIEFADEVVDKWATMLLGCIFVQIPQAAALSIGAALIAAAFSSGDHGTDGVTEGVIAFTMGIGALLAAEAMPGLMVNRRLFRSGSVGLRPGMVYNALQMGMMAAGAAYGGPVTAPVGQTVVSAVAPNVASKAASAAAGAAKAASAPPVPPAPGLRSPATGIAAAASSAPSGGWGPVVQAPPARAHIYPVVRALPPPGPAQLPPPRG